MQCMGLPITVFANRDNNTSLGILNVEKFTYHIST